MTVSTFDGFSRSTYPRISAFFGILVGSQHHELMVSRLHLQLWRWEPGDVRKKHKWEMAGKPWRLHFQAAPALFVDGVLPNALVEGRCVEIL